MKRTAVLFAILCTLLVSAAWGQQSTPAPQCTKPEIHGRGTPNAIPKFTSPTTIGNSVIFQAGKDIGIGTTSPQATLDVYGTDATAIQGSTSSTADVTWGVAGHAWASNGNAYGVVGDTATTGFGAGVMGVAYATSGTAFGGFFDSDSIDGSALFGHAAAPSGSPTAVVGQVESPNGIAGSFRAQNASAVLLEGIFLPGWNRIFTVDAAGNGFFAGNLTVNGTVSKGGGSFKIDHPLDPANKTLSHSFVESPDMMNVYNGNIRTDRHGLATVALPDYFEALNQDFRYQLTVIGQFAQAIVAKKIATNRFVIRTSKPNVEVSWQVTGIRQDAYAKAYRIQVEEEKQPQEQGHYLHPELFGAPREQALGYNASASPAR